MSQALGVLFAACLGAAALAALVGMVEFLGLRSFWSWSFRVGPSWLRRIVNLQPPMAFSALQLGSAAPQLRVRRSVDSGEILFREHIPLRQRSWVLRTRSSLQREHRVDRWHRASRNSHNDRPARFMSFWLVGWTIQALARSHFIVGIATWLAGTAMVTGMAWWSLVTERKQIRLALDKLAQEFGWPPFWL